MADAKRIFSLRRTAGLHAELLYKGVAINCLSGDHPPYDVRGVFGPFVRMTEDEKPGSQDSPCSFSYTPSLRATRPTLGASAGSSDGVSDHYDPYAAPSALGMQDVPATR